MSFAVLPPWLLLNLIRSFAGSVGCESSDVKISRGATDSVRRCDMGKGKMNAKGSDERPMSDS